MFGKVKIAPSIIAADYQNEKTLKFVIEELKRAKVELLHLDVMDGIFVANKTFDHQFVDKIKNTTDFILDVHLMVDQPEKVVQKFIQAGADILTVHFEATNKLEAVLREIKNKGLLAGVSINPETDIKVIAPFLESGLVDLVLVMAVKPGACGQKFNPSVFDKIEWLQKNYPKVDVEVDGGINLDNSAPLVQMGVDVLVSGSTIFNSADIKQTIKSLKKSK